DPPPQPQPARAGEPAAAAGVPRRAVPAGGQRAPAAGVAALVLPRRDDGRHGQQRGLLGQRQERPVPDRSRLRAADGGVDGRRRDDQLGRRPAGPGRAADGRGRRRTGPAPAVGRGGGATRPVPRPAGPHARAPGPSPDLPRGGARPVPAVHRRDRRLRAPAGRRHAGRRHRIRAAARAGDGDAAGGPPGGRRPGDQRTETRDADRRRLGRARARRAVPGREDRPRGRRGRSVRAGAAVRPTTTGAPGRRRLGVGRPRVRPARPFGRGRHRLPQRHAAVAAGGAVPPVPGVAEAGREVRAELRAAGSGV
ncbi:MAG: hypothetical protein AVDCRST_MAG64-1295, partial [uncultured Phycisphaerae bacterium]